MLEKKAAENRMAILEELQKSTAQVGESTVRTTLSFAKNPLVSFLFFFKSKPLENVCRFRQNRTDKFQGVLFTLPFGHINKMYTYGVCGFKLTECVEGSRGVKTFA